SRKPRDHGAADDGRRKKPKSELGDHSERALRPDEQLGEGKPGYVLAPRSAQSADGSIGENHLHAEDVITGDSVLHTAQATRIRCGVAADRTDLHARRI